MALPFRARNCGSWRIIRFARRFSRIKGSRSCWHTRQLPRKVSPMTRPRTMIEIDDESLCISRSREAVAFRWSEIRRIVAYKRDCLAADQLCFSISDGDWETELNEDMEGWPELIRQLPAKLHEFPA